MKCYFVDAFTDEIFKGNPAAVCVVTDWPSDQLMQNIAKENNLSETAFSKPNGDRYDLRWFTPGGEIDLCGHATLATAYVITRFYEPEKESLEFITLSGILKVKRVDDLYELDFPSYKLRQVEVTEAMEKAIGIKPLEAWIDRDLLCVLANEQQVIDAAPNMELVKKLDGLLLHLTSKGSDYDCVTRSFAPKLNIVEDPVCGSGHCHVVPYWAKRTGKHDLIALQASERSGELICKLENDRVKLSGKATLYSISELYVS